MKIQEIIVVEGLHDKQAVNRAVEADVWVVGGDRIARAMLQELRRAGAARGVIVLTDPDGPGERIRRRVAEVVPNCQHAFLAREEARAPDEQRLGVEFASPQSIIECLAKVRHEHDLTDTAQQLRMPQAQHHPTDQSLNASASRPPFSARDLQIAGLSNHPQAAQRRMRLGEALGIGYANGKSFLYKLNALGVTREEWKRALAQTFPDEMLLVCSEAGGEQDDGTPV